MADNNVVGNEYVTTSTAQYQHSRAWTQAACFLVLVFSCGGAAVGFGLQSDFIGKAVVVLPSVIAIAASGAALTSL